VQLIEKIEHNRHYGAQTEQTLLNAKSINIPSGHVVRQSVPDK
jgi:hypothetical protein